jgi:hypothetical protein
MLKTSYVTLLYQLVVFGLQIFICTSTWGDKEDYFTVHVRKEVPVTVFPLAYL